MNPENNGVIEQNPSPDPAQTLRQLTKNLLDLADNAPDDVRLGACQELRLLLKDEFNSRFSKPLPPDESGRSGEVALVMPKSPAFVEVSPFPRKTLSNG